MFWSARLAPLILRDKHKAVKFRISLKCSKMEEMNGDFLVILRGKEGYCQKATVNQTCTVGNPSCLEKSLIFSIPSVIEHCNRHDRCSDTCRNF